MPSSDLKGVPISPLTGAMDLRSSPDQLSNGSLRLRQNWQTVAKNKLRRGYGWSKLLTNNAYTNEDAHDQLLTFIPNGIRQPATLLYEAQSTSGTRSLIVGRQNSISKLNEWSGNYRILGSGYGGTPSPSAAAPRLKAAQVGDYLALTNDFDKPMFHILESAPLVPTPLIQTFDDLDTIGLSRAGCVWAWHNCLFFADVTMDGERFSYRIVWSDFNNPTSFDPANLQSITGTRDLYTYEKILGGAQFGSSFLIYTTHGIWEMVVVGGEQSFDFSRRFNGEDCKGTSVLKYPNTLVATPDAHVYAAEDGIYEFNPFYGAPRRPEWVHAGSGSSDGTNPLAVFDDIDTVNCQVHVAMFQNNEYLISTASTDAPNNCPNRTLRLNSAYNVSDIVDFGFTAFTSYRSYKVPTIRDFLVSNGICTAHSLQDDGYGYVNEGLPSPFPDSTAPFTPLSIYTSTPKVYGTSEVPGTPKIVTSYSRTGGVASFTVFGHGFATNDRVLISGVSDQTFNGPFTMTVINANTFTVQSFGPDVSNTTPGAAVRKIGVPKTGIAIVEVDGTVTIKSTAHGLTTGTNIRVSNALEGNPTLGVTLVAVTVLDADTFTYPASALKIDTEFPQSNIVNIVADEVYGANPAASGVVTTFAGTAGASGSTDATGSAARFNLPFGTCVDVMGNIYVADTANHTIRKISPTKVVSTLAGTAGVSGSTDATGSSASFNLPRGVAVDSLGNVYVADTGNHTIRQITPGGVVTTIAGTAGASGIINAVGAAARFNSPNGIAVDSDGGLYVADTGNSAIRKISGITVTAVAVAGGGTGYVIGDVLSAAGGTGTASTFTVAGVDGTGAITDISVTTSGSYTTAPGATNAATGGTGTGASLSLTFGSGSGNNVTTLAASSTTPSGPQAFVAPAGVAVGSDGTIYVADSSNHTIHSMTPMGVATQLAGEHGVAGHTDGTGVAAHFKNPTGVAVGTGGNIYVCDQQNFTMRKVTTGGVVTTEAGFALSSGSADGTGAVARFNLPSGIGTDAAGNQFVADTSNETIRKVDAGASQFQVEGLVPGRIYHYVPGANEASLTLQGTSTIITTDQFFVYDGLGALLTGPTGTDDLPVTAVISGGVSVIFKTIGNVQTPTSVSRADADNPDIATITLAAHGFAIGDRLWIYGFSDPSFNFFDTAIVRESDDVDLTANTFAINSPGPNLPAETPTTVTAAKLTTTNIVSEDYTLPQSDADSVCALTAGQRLDDFCLKCEGATLLVVSASDDWCLKQLGDVFYRERCTNPTAVGGMTGNGYVSAVATYLLDGYDSILRFSPMYAADDREAMVVLETFLLYYFSRMATQAGLRVGIGAQPVDPNVDRCDLRWFQHSLQDLKCLSTKTIPKMQADGTIPGLNTKWRVFRKGKALCVELKISGTGGDTDISSVVAEVKRAGTARF